MAAGHGYRYVRITSLISLFGLVHAVSYGPSLVSLTRWDRLSRGPTIWNPDTGRIIALSDYPNYSVVIPLAPDNPSASSNQVFISRRVSGPGEFTVEAPPGYGVMAVIQSLELRVADDTCNDFILFSEVDGGEGGGGAEATGTCGKVDAGDASASPQGLIGPRSFISGTGRMKILFYHGFIWGLVRNFNFDIFDSSLNPDLKVEIAFTAFKDCPSSLNSSQTKEGEELEDNSPHLSDKISLYAPCSPSGPDTKTCIRQELFCDGIVNCAFSSDFASDENELGCLLGRSNLIGYSKSLHSPPTTLASETTTSGEVISTEVTSSLSTTSPSSSSESSSASIEATELPITEEPPTQQSRSSIRHYKGGTGTDSAGLIGLVRKFPHVEIVRPNRTSKTIIIKSLPSTREAAIINRPEVTSTTSTTTTSTTTKPPSSTERTTTATQTAAPKMPQEGGQLFVDIQSDPIEDSLIDGVSKEDLLFNHDLINSDHHLHMSPHTLAGIFALTAILLIILGALRVYYCYNKVIWNPHGNLKEGDSPPEMTEEDHANFMRKMKALGGGGGGVSEDIFGGKKGKKEQPPSYEILFPLPGEEEGKEAEGNLKV